MPDLYKDLMDLIVYLLHSIMQELIVQEPLYCNSEIKGMSSWTYQRELTILFWSSGSFLQTKNVTNERKKISYLGVTIDNVSHRFGFFKFNLSIFFRLVFNSVLNVFVVNIMNLCHWKLFEFIYSPKHCFLYFQI